MNKVPLKKALWMKCARTLRPGAMVAGVLLLSSATSLAGAAEYLPPPTGPYQSSIVINSVESDSATQPQIYRFPPADLIQMGDPRDYPVDQREAARDNRFPNSPRNPAVSSVMPKAPAYAAPANPVLNPYQSGGMGQNNPWAVGQPDPSGQGQWGAGYQPYGYPYGYPNQYNMMNPPYSNVPSPWSVPAQPYPGR